jgi:hypothetical protein
MEKKRSVGVTIFSILYLVVGVLFVLIMPLFSLLYIIAGIGLLLLKPFARYLAVATSILGIVVGTIRGAQMLQSITKVSAGSIFINSLPLLFTLLLTYLFHLGVIFFFTRPKVKEQFK